MSLPLLCAGFLWLRAAARRPGPGGAPLGPLRSLGSDLCGWWGGMGVGEPVAALQAGALRAPQAVQWGLQPRVWGRFLPITMALERQVRLPPVCWENIQFCFPTGLGEW